MPFQAKFTDNDLITYLSKYGTDINNNQVKTAAKHFSVQVQSVHKRMTKLPQFSKVGRGRWNLSLTDKLEKAFVASNAESVRVSYVPDKDSSYVHFGNFTSLKKIVQSKKFYPTFITGLSGNGKTLSVEQV